MIKKKYILVSWHYEKRQGIRTIRKTESAVFQLESAKEAFNAVAKKIKYKNKATEKLAILAISIIPEKTQVNG